MSYSGSRNSFSRVDISWLILWVTVVFICTAFCIHYIMEKNPFHSNLLELLPHDERNPEINELSFQLANRFQDRILILVKTSRDDHQLEADYVKANQLKALLLASPLITKDDSSQNLQQALISVYRPYTQQLLTPSMREWLQVASAQDIADQTLGELLSPVGRPRPYPFIEDPFNLGGSWIQSLSTNTNIQEFQQLPLIVDPGDSTNAWFLVTTKLTVNPFNLLVQKDVSSAIETFKTQFPASEILTSGMVFHASAGTAQARAEISSVGLGSLIGIVVLVVVVFRSTLPLIAVLMTLGAGCLLALTACLFVFERVHLITLAFGSTLLGIAVDYVLHLLVVGQRLGSGLLARKKLRWAIAIGATSSISAYLLQLATPFPGLQQMAVFSAAGLIGSWLTVLVLAPFYQPDKLQRFNTQGSADYVYPLAVALYSWLTRLPKLGGAALFIVVCLSLLSIVQGGANDSVANLNTSPKALLQSEQNVQAIMQQPATSRFFYVQAETQDRLMKKLAYLDEALEHLADPQLQWQSLQRFLPTTTQQQNDQELVFNKLYGERGALELLCLKLGNICNAPERNTSLITPTDLYSTALGSLLTPIKYNDNSWQALVTLTGNSQTKDLASLAKMIDGVSFIDQTRELSSLLGRYRGSITTILLITLGLITGLLTLFYGRRSWRMLTPLIFSLMFALGVAAGDGLTLFHVMALLLVMGIGIDTAVFYLETGFCADAWLASSLSAITSILAFGLLSLSEVPVLHQFGEIVLVGILCCWLVTPLFFIDKNIQSSVFQKDNK